MRYVVLIAIVGTLVVAGWFWLARDRSAETAAMAAVAERQKAALGLKNMLRGHAVFTFESIVVGQTAKNRLVDFRGQLDLSGRRTPAYGQARSSCKEDADRTECWRIVYLEADGQEISVADGQPKETAQATAAATTTGTTGPETAATTTEGAAETPAATGETASATATTTTPATTSTTTAETPAQPPAATPAAQPETATVTATHKVARAVINTRSGPGTSNPVVTRLTAGAQLSLLESQGGWGHFVVIGGEDDGREVWAAFSILEAL